MRTLNMAFVAFLVAACGGGGGDGGGGGGSGTTPVGGICSETEECVPESICYSDRCVGIGTLRFSMSWTEDTDIDLHVITPSGAEIYFSNDSADGGTLDVDDCVGVCANPDGEHVENIVFDGTAARGEYTFWAVNYDETVPTEVTLEAFIEESSPTSFTETAPATEPFETARHMITY